MVTNLLSISGNVAQVNVGWCQVSDLLAQSCYIAAKSAVSTKLHPRQPI